MTHKGTVTLETERLILRRFTTEDADAMFRNWVNDPEVTKYLTWQPHGTIELTRKINAADVAKYADIAHYQWAIVLKSLGEPIGGINVVEIEETRQCVGVAYRIGKTWWRNGFASEALSAVIIFLFEQVGANRIVAMHNTNNPNSGAVMRKCGMSYEGTKRQADIDNQGVNDLAMYAILAEDYFSRKKSDVHAIEVAESKSKICESILRALPEWFGVPLAINEFARRVANEPFWAVFNNETPIAFIALTEHNAYTFEIDVMGVLNEYQRNGIGKRLIDTACEYAFPALAKQTAIALEYRYNADEGERTQRFLRELYGGYS